MATIEIGEAYAGGAVEVGVRALRDGLSQHLAEVRKGHIVTVTDHGRAVARIVPVDLPTSLERLTAEGLVRRPQRAKRGTPRPVAAEGSVSELVAEQRR